MVVVHVYAPFLFSLPAIRLANKAKTRGGTH